GGGNLLRAGGPCHQVRPAVAVHRGIGTGTATQDRPVDQLRMQAETGMSTLLDVSELHWLLDIVQSIDVGVVVLDREYRIQVWNSFMENHSARSASARCWSCFPR